jgi:hypothetical protein
MQIQLSETKPISTHSMTRSIAAREATGWLVSAAHRAFAGRGFRGGVAACDGGQFTLRAATPTPNSTFMVRHFWIVAPLNVRNLLLLPEALASQFISGSNPIVRDPWRFGASLQAVQYMFLSISDVGLLIPISYYTGFTTFSPAGFVQKSRIVKWIINILHQPMLLFRDLVTACGVEFVRHL